MIADRSYVSKEDYEKSQAEVTRLRELVAAIEQRAANNLNDRDTVYAVWTLAHNYFIVKKAEEGK